MNGEFQAKAVAYSLFDSKMNEYLRGKRKHKQMKLNDRQFDNIAKTLFDYAVKIEIKLQQKAYSFVCSTRIATPKALERTKSTTNFGGDGDEMTVKLCVCTDGNCNVCNQIINERFVAADSNWILGVWYYWIYVSIESIDGRDTIKWNNCI